MLSWMLSHGSSQTLSTNVWPPSSSFKIRRRKNLTKFCGKKSEMHACTWAEKFAVFIGYCCFRVFKFSHNFKEFINIFLSYVHSADVMRHEGRFMFGFRSSDYQTVYYSSALRCMSRVMLLEFMSKMNKVNPFVWWACDIQLSIQSSNNRNPDANRFISLETQKARTH